MIIQCICINNDLEKKCSKANHEIGNAKIVMWFYKEWNNNI